MTLFYPKRQTVDGVENYHHATSKVICVGRNYQEHAKELDNPIPSEPLLFIKSTNTLVDLKEPIKLPVDQGHCHHELELAFLIGKPLDETKKFTVDCLAGVALALDLTLRELQTKLKQQGHPWERAKSFDGACPVSEFIPLDQFSDIQDIEFAMANNGQRVQIGNSKDMIFDIKQLIESIVACFKLYPGDIVLSGTPNGVAALSSGDKLSFSLSNKLCVETSVK